MEQMESSQPLMEVKTYATPEEFMEQIKNMKYISQGLDELRSSSTAIIYTSLTMLQSAYSNPFRLYFKFRC